MKKSDKDPKKIDPVITTNHEARRDYFILDTMEAGIMLQGCEVKSLRTHNVSLAGSFARVDDAEVYLYNAYIAPYEMGNRENPDSRRTRKLLLHGSQIEKLIVKTQEKGLCMVPLKMFFNDRGIAKVEIAIAKGKNHFDKRSDIKKQTVKREIDRAIKSRNRK